jgi:benzodiazapine receptor
MSTHSERSHQVLPSGATGRPWSRLVPLALWVGLCWGVAGLGGVFTAMGVSDWYLTLARPSWNPPSGVFGPVWTLLYTVMGVAAWRVWTRRREAPARVALALFGVQLLLNLGWSVVFFGLRAPGWAVAEIAALWLAITATLVWFWRVDRLAGLLLAPYLAWVSFAAALNLAIWRHNG